MKTTSCLVILAALCIAVTASAGPADVIMAQSGFRGGLIVHLGCGDGALTAALQSNDTDLVHGLDRDAGNVQDARDHIRAAGLYGPVSVDQLTGNRLPYIENLVNLVVAESLDGVSITEIMRVLAPNGVALIKSGGKWTKHVKPRPDNIDDWSHYMHDSTGNAVAHDTVVGPPRRMQWVGSPRYSRHHDRMSSISAAVTSGGRVFYIFDESPPASILTSPKWTLIARDAFNGTILWKRGIKEWHDHLWPLKSGPAQLPRRLVAGKNRVYVTLSIDGPVLALDAATGATVHTYNETVGAEEIILSDGVLLAIVRNPAGNRRANVNSRIWDEAPSTIVAVHARSGKTLWTVETVVLPGTLSADSDNVVFHDGEQIVCVNRATWTERWRSAAVPRSEVIASSYLPTLVLYEDVVLFSGGEIAGAQTGGWYEGGKDTVTALSAKTGEKLWSAHHPPSGYKSPEDLFVADGLVWFGDTTSGRAEGVFTGRDPYTGEVEREFAPDTDIYWFHHRCYRGKATDNYLLMSRAGIEFIDVKEQTWDVNHWVRGACLYGIMPANGLIYAPQNPCACYQETKLSGFNALAAAGTGPRVPADAEIAPRLEQGPAYGQTESTAPDDAAWPTYRHDAARSGRANTTVSASPEPAWHTEIGGRLTSPVVAGKKLFIASIDTHTVHALDASTGDRLWHYTTGGRALTGKIGGGMRFTGMARSRAKYSVNQRWSNRVPLIARAMALADDKLFVAGPPDLVDEEQSFKRIAAAETQRLLAEQEAALAGKKGAILYVASASSGEQLGRRELESPPVFDGMIAADNRLYVSTVNGEVICFK